MTRQREPIRLRLGEMPEEEIARRAGEVLRGGGIALLPAEGVYGFHASTASPGAVERILGFKGRSGRAGFIGLVAHPEDSARWARVEPLAADLARRHWPGPLTMVLEALPDAPASARSTDGTIALRCPGSPLLRRIVREIHAGPDGDTLQALLLSTSANEPGGPPAERIDLAPPGFADLVVDGGALTGVPSTLVRVSGGEVRVLRQGAIGL